MKADLREVGLLYNFATCIPNGCYVDLGGLARVGRKENGERYMELKVDGQVLNTDFRYIEGICNELGNQLLDKKLEERGLNRELLSILLRQRGKDAEKTMWELEEKHVHRIERFLEIELAPFLSALEKAFEGNAPAGAAYQEGKISLSGAVLLRKIFSEFEKRDLRYEFRGNNAVLERLKEALDIQITAFTHYKHIEEERLQEVLQEVGEIIKERMKPFRNVNWTMSR